MTNSYIVVQQKFKLPIIHPPLLALFVHGSHTHLNNVSGWNLTNKESLKGESLIRSFTFWPESDDKVSI